MVINPSSLLSIGIVAPLLGWHMLSVVGRVAEPQDEATTKILIGLRQKEEGRRRRCSREKKNEAEGRRRKRGN